MAATIGGVLCQEVVNGFSEDVELLGGPSARKGYLCDWTDRYKVARGLLGLASTTMIGGNITLQTPLPYPEIPTTYAHRVSIEPKGAPFQGPTQIAWPKCIVWAEYATLPWSFNPSDSAFNQIDPSHPFVYAEQRLSSSVEWLQIPGSACTWAATTKPLQQPASLRLVLIDMEITIKELPYMPQPQAYTYTGLINNALYLGVNTGSLLYGGVTTQQRAVSDGTYAQEASFRFTARSVRWDYQYDPAQSAFDQVKILNGTQPIIKAVDMSQVIPPAYQY